MVFNKSGESDELFVKLEIINVLTNSSAEMVGKRKKKEFINKSVPGRWPVIFVDVDVFSHGFEFGDRGFECKFVYNPI